MAIDVFETDLATRQVRRLRGRRRDAYEKFLDHLRARGCEALQYRLFGEGILERVCARHLFSNDRVLATFNDEGDAWVLLVGPHDESAQDVYNALYQLAGVNPPDITERTKPPCCDEMTAESPEVTDEEISALITRIGRQAR